MLTLVTSPPVEETEATVAGIVPVAAERDVRRAPKAEDLVARYEELREGGKAEVDAGNLEGALEAWEESHRIAQQLEDQERIDLALCNRVGAAVMLGRPDGAQETLRGVLLRNHSPRTNCLAAYNLSWTYEYQKETKKGLFYGRIALNHALAAGDEDWIASAHNQIANCMLAESQFEEAAAEYEKALALFPRELSVYRVLGMANLAYAKAVLGDYPKALRLLYAGLRWSRRTGKKYSELWTHVDLCYVLSEMGRLRLAWKHGSRALQLAEEAGDHNVVKLALYLMGTVEKAGGEMEDAYRYFERLQREFYPEVPNLPEMMLVVDARKVVNLRA